MIDTQADQMADEFAQRIQYQGLTLDQYFQFTGLTREKMMEDLQPQAKKAIQTRLVLEAIVAAENIEVTAEELDEELTKMASMYQMELDQVKSILGDAQTDSIKKDIAVQKAVTFLCDQAKEV
jgi:trigger factor